MCYSLVNVNDLYKKESNPYNVLRSNHPPISSLLVVQVKPKDFGRNLKFSSASCNVNLSFHNQSNKFWTTPINSLNKLSLTKSVAYNIVDEKTTVRMLKAVSNMCERATLYRTTGSIFMAKLTSDGIRDLIVSEDTRQVLHFAGRKEHN
ncbi:hypothetical protein QVD17_27330 [Tagetes erecta]|uniref:Uncharacterized protein n=1 Tax=Tagetes erecta TaxID=13708 RepID=A0AAD8NRI5_TARER|nr:hypothetical protein QVD17_27330 [Tagetes erecta]